MVLVIATRHATRGDNPGWVSVAGQLKVGVRDTLDLAIHVA